MSEILLADDALYEELYDVRLEAEHAGNFVEGDVNPGMNLLRDRAPVHRGYLRQLMGLPEHHRHAAVKDKPGYTCFTWKACDAAFRDNRRFSSTILQTPSETGERRLGMLEMDEPEHKAYRATIQSMFLKPRTLTWWRQRFINEIVESLIESIGRADRAELNLQLCARVPVHTITRAVGLTGDDTLLFRHALIRSTAARCTAQERAEAGRTVDRMLLELITRRRAVPEDDITSGLIRAEFDLNGERRPLTDREVLVMCKLVMLAGGGTSWRQMGITIWALLTHRDQLEAVRADRALIEAAIEEGVRWNPTDPVFSRLVTQDTEFEGVAMEEGSALEICLGAANRDPARWADPDAYDLHRPAQPHLGFGMGTHQCLGMNVAKSEITVAINALLDAFPAIRLDPAAPAPFVTGGLEQRGMSGIPVLLR